MNNNLLNPFLEDIRKSWGPLSSSVVAQSQAAIAKLLKASIADLGLTDMDMNLIAEKELYRDPEKGFMLLAHTEQKGQYRVPHDHGSGWVIYSVLQGEIEMRTYKQMTTNQGKSQLVRRETYRVAPGDSRVYLPGDIHDTRCLSDSVIMLRFSSCDIKKESREGRMIRYIEEVTE